MAMNFRVYQLPSSNNMIFRDYDLAKGNISIRDYVCVYNGAIPMYVDDEDYFLEKIFQKCQKDNKNCLKDYYARSLSVSDVVEFDGEYYYCDFMGWVKIAKENFV